MNIFPLSDSLMLDLISNTNHLFVTPKPRFYTKSVLHKDSQFNEKGGSQSCTYICLEMAVYYLHGFVHPDGDLLPLIKTVVQSGVSFDIQVGHRSCDEVYKATPRYQKQLNQGNLLIGKLRDDSVFINMLSSMKSKASTSKRVCLILTKPPETILVCYDAEETKYPFVVFDSHPRTFETVNGAGFYFFSNMDGCEKHLKTLFPKLLPPSGKTDSLEYLEWLERQMFEGTFVSLKENVEFESAAAFRANLIKQMQQAQQVRPPTPLQPTAATAVRSPSPISAQPLAPLTPVLVPTPQPQYQVYPVYSAPATAQTTVPVIPAMVLPPTPVSVPVTAPVVASEAPQLEQKKIAAMFDSMKNQLNAEHQQEVAKLKERIATLEREKAEADRKLEQQKALIEGIKGLLIQHSIQQK